MNPASDQPHRGIPIGNTVAVVGDPGTGKTTFLLTYLSKSVAETSVIKLLPKFDSQESVEERINRLFLVPNDPDSDNGSDTKNNVSSENSNRQSTKKEKDNNLKKHHIVRCFISLENSFDRMLAHHPKFLERCPNEPMDSCYFIDATSFLSGRLEDRHRYPENVSNQKNSDVNRVEFVLTQNDAGKHEHCLAFIENENKLRRADSLDSDKISKRLSPTENEKRLTLINLMTPPVSDIGTRVRLLKDLLALILNNLPSDPRTILGVDSLSALLATHGEPQRSDEFSGIRRLGILNFVRWLEEREITTFFACEASRTEETTHRQPLFLGKDERYLVSGIIQLDYHKYRSGDLARYLRILKMRGAKHDMRAHAYELGPEGIEWLELLFGEPEDDN